jgi:uncharacterized membrane protein YGL010W
LLRLSPTPRLQAHVDRYGQSHRTRPNQILHFIGIPILLVSSLGLLAKVPFPTSGEGAVLQPDAAWVVLLVAGLWYFWVDWRIAPLVTALFVGGYLLGGALTLGPLAALFAAGVVAHVVGHFVFEGKPPALLTRPVAILEAPVWLLAVWIGLYR